MAKYTAPVMVIVQQGQIVLHVVVTVVEATVLTLLIVCIHLMVHPQIVIDLLLVAAVDNHMEE